MLMATMNRRQRWVALALVGYAVAYFAWTWLRWGDPVVISDVAALPLVAVAAYFQLRRAPRRFVLSDAARWLGAACLCWLCGEAAWFYLEVLRESDPFPSVADGFYLAFYPLAFLGLRAVPVRAPRQRDALVLMFDILTVAVAGLMVLWYLVIGPTITDSGGSWLATTLAVAYPLGDLILVVGLARVLLRQPGTGAERPLRLALAGIACLVIADVAFAYLDLGGNYDAGTLPDAFWAFAFLGITLAALHMRGDRRPTMDVHVERARLTVFPFAGVLVGLGVLALQAANPRPGALVPLIAFAAILGVVLVCRQGILQRDHERAMTELEHLASSDPLTGLSNRRHFFAVGADRAARAVARGETVAVLVCDIDDFKLVNDVYGHATGDAVLVALARRCRQAARSSDIAARIGGDEFALLLIGCTPERAREIADSVRNVPLVDDDHAAITAHVSVGIAVSDTSSDLDCLLREADDTLYDTKREARLRAAEPRAGGRAPADTPGSGGRPI
jgi:diguanylate cyclase (GGDEF)-like protein